MKRYTNTTYGMFVAFKKRPLTKAEKKFEKRILERGRRQREREEKFLEEFFR